MSELPCPTSQWPRFSALLDMAMDVPEAQLPAWLASLSGDDAMVRPWLARVLAGAATGGAAPLGLKTGLFDDLAKDDFGHSAFAAGDQIGPYRLVSLLGEGGMGQVWRATRGDDGPQREIALKLPHAEMLNPAARKRFARERDMLASLSHPHIAQLYDAGSSAEGHPYLALELVQGEPITQACRGASAPLERRIELVLQVLQGLAYAHQRLIVHRDIKPSNVLVTSEGLAKLLDFGIAKLLDTETLLDAALTQPQSRLATPGYGAPEQGRGGNITVAADLFSVGVLLFELCTGQRPFVRVPLEQDAPLPPFASRCADPQICGAPEAGRLRKRLRGDLDAVLAKAIALDPSARYASAEAFAADLRAWRKGLPVRARRIGVVARARKFVRRNRLGVSLAAVLALALAGGTAGVAWQAHRAEAQAARANAIKDFLIGLFKQGYPKDGNQPSGTMTARALLDMGADQADEAFTGDPATEIELLATLGSIYDALRESGRSQPIFKRKLELSRALYGDRDPRVLDSAIDLAWNYAEWSRPEESAALLDSIRQPLLSRYGAQSLQWAQWLEVRAEVLTATLGGNHQAQDDSLAAVEILQAHFGGSRELVDALFVLMGCQISTEAYPDALATAARIRRTGAAQNDLDSMDELTLRLNEAVSLAFMGRLDEAEKTYASTKALAERVVGGHSNHVVDALDGQANVAHLRGDRSRALALFQRAADVNQGASIAQAGSVFWVRDYPAALVREGRAAEAMPLLLAALQRQPEGLTLSENRVRELRASLADAYDQLGRAADARPILLAVRDAALRDGPPSSVAVQSARERWARFLFEHGDVAGADTEFAHTVEAARAAPSAPAARAEAGLARIALLRHNTQAALAHSAHAISLLAATQAQYDVRARVDIWQIRAECLAMAGQTAEARALATEAASAAEQYDAPASPQLARIRATLQAIAGLPARVGSGGQVSP